MAVGPDSILDAWEREPLADVPEVALDLSADALFDAVRTLSRAPDLSSRGVVLDAFAPGAPPKGTPAHHAWLDSFVPGPADASFEAWAERQHRPYLLHCSHIHRFSNEVWSAVERTTRELFERVGLPDAQVWVDCYAGDYDITPFGVHIDGSSNFTFGVHGSKELLLWEPEAYWDAWAETGDFVIDDSERGLSLLERATSLVVEPGRTIYWPSRFWHVARPGPGLSVTVNISAYWRSNATDEASSLRASYARRVDDPISLLQAFRDSLTDEEIAQLVQATEPLLRTLLPRVAPSIDRASVGDSLRAGSGAVAAEGTPEATHAKLAYLSSGGLGPAAPTPLAVPQRCRGGSTWVWAQRGTCLVVGVAGHTFEVEATEGTAELLTMLGRGGEVPVERLTAELISRARFGPEPLPNEVKLQRLVAVGAIRSA